MPFELKTPVAIIVFKRLDATKRLFKAVREARPKDLYIIADGWRNDTEKEKCLAVRKYLESTLDWPCNVHRNYAPENMGCKMRIVSGLNWVFGEVEEAIVIEDDCVPDQSFFQFCQELLLKYRNEPKIMQISGLNLQQKNFNYTTNGASYYFSDLGEIWGWATWRRAWKLYDVGISAWPKAKSDKLLSSHFSDPAVVDYWEHLFDEIYEARTEPRKFDAWAAQWVFVRFLAGGVSAVSKTNLIQNFGFTKEATRSKDLLPEDNYKRPIVALDFPLVHPDRVEVHKNADNFTLHDVFKIKRKLIEKVLFFLKRHAPGLHRQIKRLKVN